MRIKIPFTPDMAEAISHGRKTMTTRTKKYGKVGDTFTVWGKDFELIDIQFISLERVALGHYQEEGFHSVEGFIKKWEELHPRKGYIPNQLVWLHVFREVT
jgi:hypothetical protein